MDAYYGQKIVKSESELKLKERIKALETELVWMQKKNSELEAEIEKLQAALGV